MKKSHIAILLVLVVVAVSMFFVFTNPAGRLVKLAVEKFVPEMTQSAVHVSRVDISTSDGKGKLSNLVIGNPKGFKTDYALKAGRIEMEIEPASITKDVVVIHKVLIDAPSISYEKNNQGSNFDAIQRNVESYLGGSGGKGKQAEGGDSKKMIIDSFVIRNAKVNYNGTIELSLPDIELHNIGKKSGGATSAQVTKAIISALNTKLTLALAKTVAIGAVGGPVIGAGMAIKSLLGK